MQFMALGVGVSLHYKALGFASCFISNSTPTPHKSRKTLLAHFKKHIYIYILITMESLYKGHLSNETTVPSPTSPNHIKLCINLPVN